MLWFPKWGPLIVTVTQTDGEDWGILFCLRAIFPHTATELTADLCFLLKRVFYFVRASPACWAFQQGNMGEVSLQWIGCALRQEGRQPGPWQWWAAGPDGVVWITSGSQCLGWHCHLWGFFCSELSLPSSPSNSDEKCFSGNMTFSSLVQESWKNNKL